MGTIDKLIDLLRTTQQPSWVTFLPVSRRRGKGLKITMSVVPDGRNSHARIEFRDNDDEMDYGIRMNLPALDNHIGNLITIRDALESVTK